MVLVGWGYQGRHGHEFVKGELLGGRSEARHRVLGSGLKGLLHSMSVTIDTHCPTHKQDYCFVVSLMVVPFAMQGSC